MFVGIYLHGLKVQDFENLNFPPWTVHFVF